MPPSTASRGVTAGIPCRRSEDDAAVRDVDTRHDLDERGLSRAVLAEERMHLAGAHVEIDILEHAHAREGLRDPGEGDERRHASRPPRTVTVRQPPDTAALP